MKHVRYQVFISSTFRDLREERQAVLDAILNMNHFPAGMELFPASDSTPWQVIERVIDDSDYYVLIIGGMYGSTDTDGISYTEREYNYAKKTNKAVLAFLHDDTDTIPAGKVEMEPATRMKLQEFRDKLQSHHCKFWKNAQELQYKVAISLIQEINLNPAIGWIRANDANNEDLLKKIVSLTQENDRLRELSQSQADQFRTTLSNIQRPSTVNLFYSYSRADEEMAQRLQLHLSLLKRQNIIDSWSDRQIDPIEKFDGNIRDELENADIILFLISADFMASEYAWDVELKRALERHESGEATVIPVILRPCEWAMSPLGKLMALPMDGRPITNWTNLDFAFTDVSKGIRAAVKNLRNT